MLYRNDDVAFGSNTKKAREIRGIFEEFGIKEMYSVSPQGKNCYIDPYTIPFDRLEKLLGDQLIIEDRAVDEFIKESLKRGHSISLHGWKHTLIQNYTYEKQFEYIAQAKQFLENRYKTKIEYFVPPFNTLNNDTINICEQLNLKILAANPNQLEWLVRDNADFKEDEFCWYHYRRFYENGLTPNKLREWLQQHYSQVKH